ncbi:carbohydrate-binding family 9-like protein [Adhaeribacter radiodurans]|uniref:Carbohydrate-binding domain-containing protein n=1 Tax=Adhaeribacter radiodurans TaxID=2745197 RepID=A0A7L7L953_9BACT|nr:carbohydrate-binding family 9-like protein [Adhaeribacter radiodurans]QMU29348.1 hypothetical protein HUW48_15475 [Adhaeribacter radiodurans]
MEIDLFSNYPSNSSQVTLSVSYLPLDLNGADIKAISQALDNLPRQKIAAQPWPEFTYQPEVNFSIAHNLTWIFLKYYVTEEFVRIDNFKLNDPVYQDSCVEFFISFNAEAAYYNLEFNALGICRAGYGPNRENRQLLKPEQLRSIQTATTLTRLDDSSEQNFYWQLTLAIPIKIFDQHQISSLQGMQARANFYKCGDNVPQPHFLSWSKIVAPQPNFHLPAFFGNLVFE